MTLEEAAERVLRGDSLMACLQCQTMGFIFTGEKSPDGNARFKICTTCDMRGYVYEPTYKRACRILGKPLPAIPQPFSMKREFNKKEFHGVLERYAEEDAKLSLRLMTELKAHPPLEEP
jgi:hypothetical protein